MSLISATYDDVTPTTGCVQWPTPNLVPYPCGNQITDPVRDAWAPVATEMLYVETGYRFPGVRCTETFQVCLSCRCGRWCSWCEADRIDLWRIIPFPILELVQLVENGTAALAARLAQFRIERQRWLVRHPDTGWPISNLQVPPGVDSSTAVFEVRYGRYPPAPVVRARDQLLYLLIMHNEPPAGAISRQVDVEVEVREADGRTIRFTPAEMAGFRDWVQGQYGPKLGDIGAMIDPAEDSYQPHLDLVTYP